MTDTTDLPHSRACGMNCSGHGAACSKNCPTCAGNPDWTPDDSPERASDGVRATIAVEHLERLTPDAFRGLEWDAPATPGQLADVLEALHGVVVDLQQRAAAAETERDHYRETVAGGRAWLGLVVPELVYPRRMVLGADIDPAALEDWRATGGIYALPPDPLTVLQQEVADLTAAVGRLADRGREQHPEPPRLACRADQFCEASEHYIACPAYTNSAGH